MRQRGVRSAPTRTRVAAVALSLIGLLPLAGCSSSSSAEIESTVRLFYDSYRQHDGAKACSLLAAASRAAVAQSSDKPCSEGILEETLPPFTPIMRVSVYGDQAQVRSGTDTAFVARFPSGWRVMAVGCVRHPGVPYDCQVEAG